MTNNEIFNKMNNPKININIARSPKPTLSADKPTLPVGRSPDFGD